MVQRNARRGGAIFRPAKRKMFWVRKDNTHSATLGIAEDLFDRFRLEHGLLANPPGLTIIRWLLSLSYRAVAVDDTVNRMRVGLIVAPREDPPPTSAMGDSPDRDWVLWDQRSWVQERQEGTPTQNLMQHHEWDLHTARKLDAPGRTAWLMTEGRDSDTMDLTWYANLLVKLP